MISNQDLGGHAKTIDRLDHLNRILKAIRNVNQLITHTDDQDTLLQGTCNCLTETRGFFHAWIAIFDERGQLEAAVESGIDDAFGPVVRQLEIDGAKMPCCRTALTSDTVFITEDPQRTCTNCPMAATYRGRGAMSARISHEDQTFGVLSVSVPISFARDEEECTLLREVGADIGFALYSMKEAARRRTAEEELYRLRQIIMHLPYPMSFLDSEYRYQAVNKAYTTIYGKIPADIIGHCIAEFYRPDQFYKDIKPQLDRCLDGEELTYHVRVNFAGCGQRWMHMHYCPFRDEAGTITGVISHGSDITKQKNTEITLHNREQELYRAQTMAHMGSFRINIQTKEVTATDQARDIYGLKPDELSLPLIQQIPLSEYRDTLDAAFADLIEKGTPYDQEFRIRRRSDGAFRFIHSVAEYDPAQHLVFGSIQDVTSQRELQQQLRQAEKMEAIGQLAGGIAHDFNNQLAGIMGYADIILLEANQDVLKSYASKILQASERTGELTKKMLAFARKGQHQSIPVDLHELIHEVVDILNRSIDKNIEIRLKLSANPSTTKGDPTQLQNAILNLAINARDAMPDGGLIRIETSVENLDEAYCLTLPYKVKPASYLCLCITDTGIGIPAENIRRIFEPFFTTKKVNQGTGLGPRRCIRDSKNTTAEPLMCIAKLNLGQRSDCIFRLNILKPSRTNQLRQKLIQKKHTENLLVVDDEELIRNLSKTILTALGYQGYNLCSGPGCGRPLPRALAECRPRHT